jgi:hypothetical protein
VVRGEIAVRDEVASKRIIKDHIQKVPLQWMCSFSE